MDDYDAYIIHASENKMLATGLSEGLANLGFRVWCNSFEPGFSLKRQMEQGLRTASCQIVLVTEDLFRKKWALEE